MPYICKDCSNKTRFTAVHDVTQWGTEDVTIDENGNVEDSDGFYCNDSEITEVNDLECNECGSCDVEDVSLTEWENWEGPEDEDEEEELDPNKKGDNESWSDFLNRRAK